MQCTAPQGNWQLYAKIMLTLLQISTAFRQVDEHGQPIKRSTQEVADILQLPVLRY